MRSANETSDQPAEDAAEKPGRVFYGVMVSLLLSLPMWGVILYFCHFFD